MSRIVGLNAFEPDAIQLVSRKVKKDVCVFVENRLPQERLTIMEALNCCWDKNEFHFIEVNSRIEPKTKLVWIAWLEVNREVQDYTS